MKKIPDGLILSWYGDDYTGSAVVMDVLTFAGMKSVLFLGLPTPAQRAVFADARAIGIAGTARAHDPAWMEQNLPEIFRYLATLNTPVTHYKVCSTLDSGPQIGSIGKAIDLAMEVFSSPWVPLLVAAPPMRRYQAFGNLFASSPDGIRRLDRHPVMTRHPITPMDEADVAVHISRQTSRKFGTIDLENLAPGGDANEALRQQLEKGAEIISLDSIDEATQAAAGRLIWTEREGGIFAVGSQG
ncbi:MAG: four-carbon acid sugar kinase family protein, partial [Hyphomicrobiales bacterium]